MGEAAKIINSAAQNDLDGFAGKHSSTIGGKAARQSTVFEQEIFQSMLTRERWRAERSRKPFVLMLLFLSAMRGWLGPKLFGLG